MAERYSFFNAEVDTSGNYDRTYLAEDIASYFASFVGNGVYANSADNLKVVPSDAMTVAVKAGKGWIKGYYYENDSDLEFPLDNADGAKGRIDSVVLRLDLTNRYLRVFVKKGALATNPVAPTLTRNADVYELQLATIAVPAGATAIAEAQITDTRFNSAVCGVVAGVIEQIDATNLFSQYDDAFNTWFESAKGILNSDTAIQLSNRIDTVDTAVSQASSVFINNQSSNQVFYNNMLVWQKQFFIYNNGVIGNNGNIWIHWSAYPNNYEFNKNENGKLIARGGYGDTQLKIISGGYDVTGYSTLHVVGNYELNIANYGEDWFGLSSVANDYNPNICNQYMKIGDTAQSFHLQIPFSFNGTAYFNWRFLTFHKMYISQIYLI